MKPDFKDPADVLSRPLVCVAGINADGWKIVVEMHQGFDQLYLDVDRLWPRWKDLEPNALFLVAGSREHPTVRNPVYVVVERTPEAA